MIDNSRPSELSESEDIGGALEYAQEWVRDKHKDALRRIGGDTVKPHQFTAAQIEYLKHLCTKAVYQTTGQAQLTRAFPLTEDGREVVAAWAANRFERLVRELGIDHYE